MKLPFMQFFPRDWLSDPRIQPLDAQERGIYFHLVLMLWESESQGELVISREVLVEILTKTLRCESRCVSASLDLFLTYGLVEFDGEKFSQSKMIADVKRVSEKLARKSEDAQIGPIKAGSPTQLLNSAPLPHLSPLSPQPALPAFENPEPEVSPVLAGCEYFRATKSQLHQALETWQANGNDPLDFEAAILEVDNWMKGTTKGGRQARRSKCHTRRIHDAWVIRNVSDRIAAREKLVKARKEGPATVVDKLNRQKEQIDEQFKRIEGAEFDILGYLGIGGHEEVVDDSLCGIPKPPSDTGSSSGLPCALPGSGQADTTRSI